MYQIPKKSLISGRRLRKDQTKWEVKLWGHLRHKKLGFRFNRQVYVDGYLLDFCCKDKKMNIEIDGGYHKTESGRLHDQIRSQALKNKGYKILRFWNAEIDNNINDVLEKIIKELG